MSQIYRQLVISERKLRDIFITRTVSNYPTTERSQYRLRSYRLLCHAEIEDFIESKVLNKISIEKLNWQEHAVIPKCLANLLAYRIIELPGISSTLAEISSKNDIEFRIFSVISAYETMVKKNHGIKEKNIIPLLVCIGVDYTRLNQTLLNNMSSFGAERGSTAHLSSMKVKQLIDPRSEIEKVSQIINDLSTVDELIDSIT